MNLVRLWAMSKPFSVTVHIALFAACPLMQEAALKTHSHTRRTNALICEPYMNPGKNQ